MEQDVLQHRLSLRPLRLQIIQQHLSARKRRSRGSNFSTKRFQRGWISASGSEESRVASAKAACADFSYGSVSSLTTGLGGVAGFGIGACRRAIRHVALTGCLLRYVPAVFSVSAPRSIFFMLRAILRFQDSCRRLTSRTPGQPARLPRRQSPAPAIYFSAQNGVIDELNCCAESRGCSALSAAVIAFFDGVL